MSKNIKPHNTAAGIKFRSRSLSPALSWAVFEKFCINCHSQFMAHFLRLFIQNLYSVHEERGVNNVAGKPCITKVNTGYLCTQVLHLEHF